MSKNPAKKCVRRKPLFRTEVIGLGGGGVGGRGKEGPACATPLRHHSHRSGTIQKKRRRRLGSHSTVLLRSAIQPYDRDTEDARSIEGEPTPDHQTTASLAPDTSAHTLPTEAGCGGALELSGCEEDDLLSGMCPEDFSFSLNTSTTNKTATHDSLAPPHPSPVPLLTSSPALGYGGSGPASSRPCPGTAHCLQTIPGEAGCSRLQAIPVGVRGLHSVQEGGDDMELGHVVNLIPESPPPESGSMVGEVREREVKGDVREGEVKGDVREGEVKGEEGSFFGLPVTVQALLEEHRGIKELYDWQERCLRLPRVLAGGNLLYCLPTSGGKTLVAEILILRQLLLQQKDVLLVLPYVSLVQEKVRDFARFSLALGFAVEEYAAIRGKIPPHRRRRKKVVYVATIEKASGLVDSLIEQDRLQSVGLVVVDELHMLGDGSVRGATLETCLTKILCLSSGTQIVGMSATLSNTSDLATFLGAQAYCSDFRPVELREYVKLGSCVYSVTGEGGGISLLPDRDITASQLRGSSQADPDQLVALVSEVLPHSSCLVFCATKRGCQNAALLLARQLPSCHGDLHAAARSALLQSLAVEASGVCPVLARTVPVGVAYHHSGLTGDERRLVEEGFSRGELNILFCTSTLAAGVNLPARRVILRSPYIGTQLLSHSQYKQMVGRAGRKGLTQCGESVLMAREEDRCKQVMELLSSPHDCCDSSLMCDGASVLACFILSLVGLKLAKTTSDLHSFLRATLFYQQSHASNHTPFLSHCQETVASLVAMGYITMKTVNSTCSSLCTTSLGRATFKGCLSVGRAEEVYRELLTAQSCLVLSTNLHLLFLATPTDHAPSTRPNWLIFFQTLTGLSEDGMKVAELVGVSPSVLSKLATGTGGNMSDQMSHTYHRFYLSLMMHRLLSEGTQSPGGVAKKVGGVWSVAEHFQCSRGFLQSAVSSVSAFAYCLVHFTQELPELWALHQLLPSVAQQLSHSTCADLVQLMDIPGVRQGRARQLLQAGYPTPQSLAPLSPSVLCECVDHLYPKQARRIIQAAKALLQDRAEVLFEEAEDLMAGFLLH